MTLEKKIEKILKKKEVLSNYTEFRWIDHSELVARYCPQYIDPEKYNWY